MRGPEIRVRDHGRLRGADVHVVVCVKMVPDTTQVRIDPTTNTLVREGIPFITNPFDDHAVEEALHIKDAYGAKVTVVSMGPPAAEVVIRKAVSQGADWGILLSDRAFGGADTLATSKVLAYAISEMSKEDPVDLVLCGKQTIDGDTAQVGPGIATRLGYTQLTLVDKVLTLDAAGKKIVVRRKTDEQHEIIEARLPALLTIVREANKPRYPTVPRRIYAEEINIPVWNNYFLKLQPEDIGLRGSPTWVQRIFAPERKMGDVVSAEEEGNSFAVDTIMTRLHQWKIIGT
jgi:electron transfer flavoprotein beta subunit